MAALTRRAAIVGLAATATLRPDRAFAAWPERNINMIHGLTAGGGVDVSARLIADGLSKRRGQQIVVEPKPGAGGTLASAQTARATPDGYSLCWIPSGYAVTVAMYKSLPFDPLSDFTIIGQAIDFPFVMVTYADNPTIRSIPDLIKVAKSRSEPVLGGVPGAGTPQHMLLEYLSRLAGIKIQVVPFRGGNQALTELLGKRLDFLVDPPIALIGQVKSGALHAIGTTGEKPYEALPGVGTVAAAGFPGFNVTSWMGMVGPARLPPDVTKRLNAEINALIADPEMIEKIHRVGSDPKGGTPDDFKKLIANDIARWTKVVAEAGIERI